MTRDIILDYLLTAYRVGRTLLVDATNYALLLWQQAQNSLPAALGLGVLALIIVAWALRKPAKNANPYAQKDSDMPTRPDVDIPPPDYSQRTGKLQTESVDEIIDKTKADSGFLARAGQTFSHSDDIASRRQHLQDIESRLIELKTLYQSGLISLDTYVTQSRQLASK